MMHSNLMSKTIVATAAAVLIGVGALSPVSAATSSRTHTRATPYVQQQVPYNAYNAYNQYGERWSYDRANPAFNFGQGDRCITDEGYGRWSPCDGGGGSN